MKKYFKIWVQLARCSFGRLVSTKIDGLGYLAGKGIRLLAFWALLTAIFRETNEVVGYTKYEVLLFFLTYYVLDVATQIAFRGIYLFRTIVKQGDFDFMLISPTNTLFLVMTRLVDFIDAVFFVPLCGFWIWVLIHVANTTLVDFVMYLFFAVLGVALITAIHILVAALTIFVTENQHAIFLYRETMRVGQFPPDILPKGVQVVLTYVFPVIIIVAFPAKALLGELKFINALTALGVTVVFFFVSVHLWRFSIRKYSSASS